MNRYPLSIVSLIWMALSAASSASAGEAPRWAEDPQLVADEGEVAYVGVGTDSASADAAKAAAHKAASRAAVEATLALWSEASGAVATELEKLDAAIDASKARAAIASRAREVFGALPVEKWHAVQEQEGDEVQVKAWVFVQLAKMEHARLILEAAGPLVRSRSGAKVSASDALDALRRALSTVSAELPPH